ncbi:phage portal protein [Aliiglaciecola sp. 3_MG-2023]|uniref:phage portal protein n=1 Tax=Aliiglaciecola sp. 3_MG-2023 TaxID=3062644 RepID=UPI0026E48E85|nr:phage portal protein [Aliiglaciecola sp. 3_MG-2023]MDO6691809.1 phage portal protein [Aliiglaciecola sp. 3_MG-2023]
MNLLKIFKRSEPVTDSYELLQSMGIGAPTSSGKHVNSEIAQTLPAVYCAVATIAESVASLPIHVYKRTDEGKQRQSRHHVEQLLNHRPNAYQTAYDFKMGLLRSVLLRGNGYAHISYDGTGKANALTLLHPDSVQVELLTTGRLGYKHTNTRGKHSSYLQEEILHVRYHSDDGILGKSPIQVCRESIGLGLAQQEHGASQFKNGVRVSGVLETDAKLTDEQFKALSKMFDKHQGSGNTNKPLLLEGGLRWNQIGLANNDAQWLESRLFTISDVARMFKISPIFLMDYSNSTYSNFSEASRAFLTQTLRPWLSNLQEAIASRLISDSNRPSIAIEFETKDLLRATAEDRFSVYDVAIRNGVMNPNECRAAENLPPRKGGDEYSQSWIQKGQTETTE